MQAAVEEEVALEGLAGRLLLSAPSVFFCAFDVFAFLTLLWSPLPQRALPYP